MIFSPVEGTRIVITWESIFVVGILLSGQLLTLHSVEGGYKIPARQMGEL